MGREERTSQNTSIRCAHCRAPVVWHGNPHRPFCSVICRLLDLGVWLDEGYRIEAEPMSPPSEELDVP